MGIFESEYSKALSQFAALWRDSGNPFSEMAEPITVAPCTRVLAGAGENAWLLTGKAEQRDNLCHRLSRVSPMPGRFGTTFMSHSRGQAGICRSRSVGVIKELVPLKLAGMENEGLN